ncbi:MAG: hypothetical protein JXQ83_08940 [Candidatus Glassbacteria bacterium]|nr:hypothetical protein [Candidatus Glassbacteria bacterium]
MAPRETGLRDLVDALRDAADVFNILKDASEITRRPYSPFMPPDKTGAVSAPPWVPPVYRELDPAGLPDYLQGPGSGPVSPLASFFKPPFSFILPPGPDSSGPVDPSVRLGQQDPLESMRGLSPAGGWGGGNPLGDLLSVLMTGTERGGQAGGALDILSGGNGGLSGFLDWIGQAEERYLEMVESITAGNREASDSIAEMFEGLVSGGDEAAARTVEGFGKMREGLFQGLADYASKLGVLAGLAAKVFLALRSLNPAAALAASLGLKHLAQAMRSIGGGPGAGGYSGQAAGSTAEAAETGAGKRPMTQVIIIDSGGRRVADSSDLDRAFDRAGVDRALRGQIRELVRSGDLGFIEG